MSGVRNDLGVVLGGSPRANLLPPEVRDTQKTNAAIRLLIAGVVTVAIVTGAGIALAFVSALGSQAGLDAERQRTQDLIQEQLEYGDARKFSNRVAAAEIALVAATTTEIDWKSSLDEIADTLPSGVTLTSVKVDSISPIEEAAAADGPLQKDWIATLTLVASSLNVPDVEAWLDSLDTVTGFAGIAPPASVDGSPKSGYTATIEVHIDSRAFLNRYLAEGQAN